MHIHTILREPINAMQATLQLGGGNGIPAILNSTQSNNEAHRTVILLADTELLKALGKTIITLLLYRKL
jgi:hypothetical protein